MGMRMQPGIIRMERLRQNYGCSILARRKAVSLVETNEGSSNLKSRRSETEKKERKRKSRWERIR